jgi:hypothetical protein
MGGTTNQREANWKVEFEATGETALRNDLQLRGGVGVGISDESKRQYAFRWLRERERERERREHSMHWYVRWTFWAAVGAVLIGIIGVTVTIFTGH